MKRAVGAYLTRRHFVEVIAYGFGLGRTVAAKESRERASEPAFFRTRGVVLIPEHLTLQDWPEWAKRAGLSTIALHDSLSARKVARFTHSSAGEKFLEKCRFPKGQA
jgi:hypothetical protein